MLVKVRELIEKLQEFDSESEVCVLSSSSWRDAYKVHSVSKYPCIVEADSEADVRYSEDKTNISYTVNCLIEHL